MTTAEEKRIRVRDAYRAFIGRNHYSQDLRNWCLKPYKDGRYYSDCSSSVSYAYKQAGVGFGIMTTPDMWQSKDFVDVDVTIEKGIIRNPGALRVGDMLLFAGSNPGRKYVGYVGHVEMVGEIDGGTVQLYGHGSGLAKKHEMNAYCRGRYGSKTDKTPVGNLGLLKVRRFLVDEEGEAPLIGMGDKGRDVLGVQTLLLSLGFRLPKYGADGEYGEETRAAVMAFQTDYGLDVTGSVDVRTAQALHEADAGRRPSWQVLVTGESVYVRAAPTTAAEILGVVHKGETLAYGGERSPEGWYLVAYKGVNAWISGRYARIAARDGGDDP